MSSIGASKAVCYTVAIIIIIISLGALAVTPVLGVIGLFLGFIFLFVVMKAFWGL